MVGGVIISNYHLFGVNQYVSCDNFFVLLKTVKPSAASPSAALMLVFLFVLV